jgi:hypothetical protein
MAINFDGDDFCPYCKEHIGRVVVRETIETETEDYEQVGDTVFFDTDQEHRETVEVKVLCGYCGRDISQKFGLVLVPVFDKMR